MEKTDIVDIIKNISYIKLILEMVLTNNQKQLIPYLNMNLLKNDKSSTITTKSTNLSSSLTEEHTLDTLRRIIINSDKIRKDRIFLSFLANIQLSPLSKKLSVPV